MPATSLWDKLQEIGPRAGRLELLKRHPGNWWDDIAQALGASALGPSGNALTPYDFGGTPGALVDNTEPLAEWLTALEAESVAGGPKSTTMGCLPPGLWITEDELYLQQQGITLLCHGATLMQADYAELPHVLTIGVPTSGMEQTDSTYRCGIHALNINGNSDYNAKEWAGGAGRSALRLFDAGRTHIDHVRVYKSTALGVLEDCSVNPAGSSAGNTSIITNTQVQFAASGGFKFLGAKNSTYANLQADNCYCGETQAASEAAPGFWWRARSFSDTDGDGLGDGPSETTQCIVSNCKSSNNGGHGFVFDGMAKYTVSNLNSNANTLCGYMLQNTVLDEVDPDPASLTTATAAISGAWSNLSSRRDGDDKDVIGLDVADNVYVTALTITGLNIIGGSSSLWSGSDKLGLGARVRGLNGLTLTGLSITNAPGTGLVVEKGSLVSPLTPADRETTRLNIGNFKIASCGSTEVNAYATCHGIHV
ncbi:MAG: hypothetical protein DRQ55_12725 [Planctomycetota bacterium]|nr:MAG: hypothetical protein DRQ55_12725 [Planctomycetota bacterium]